MLLKSIFLPSIWDSLLSVIVYKEERKYYNRSVN